LYGLAQDLHPVYPLPAHCAQRGDAQPEGSGEEAEVVVVLVGPAEVELVLGVLLGVGAGVVEPVMPNHSMSASPFVAMLWVTPLP